MTVIEAKMRLGLRWNDEIHPEGLREVEKSLHELIDITQSRSEKEIAKMQLEAVERLIRGL